MANNIRRQRLENFIREELNTILRHEVSRSTVKNTTVTDVRMAPDLSNATVYIDVLDRVIVKRVASDLNSMAGFLKATLAKRMTTYRVPSLRFIPDDTIDKSMRIEEILKQTEKDSVKIEKNGDIEKK